MTLRNPPVGTGCKECGHPNGHNLGCRIAHKEDMETIARLRTGLDRAAYALFQIKRMHAHAIPKFAADAHEAACAVLDGDGKRL